MSREINEISYSDVDWTLANCRGVGTDLFFLEEELLRHKGLEFSQVRAVCFTCPIRQQCLKWAYANRESTECMAGFRESKESILPRKIFTTHFLARYAGIWISGE